ncbi:MAG TPA: hypothetical protein VMD30_07125 [Tepidisphaeraceae bacterium]|nr:hypothetical protein [Tepidisphaeraceae bacterium]
MSQEPEGDKAASSAGQILWLLLVVNAVLLCWWAFKLTAPQPAVAQMDRPGDYLLVPGEVVGGNSDVVYILDQTNDLLSAMTFDDSRGKIESMPPLNLNQIFQAAAVPGVGRGY